MIGYNIFLIGFMGTGKSTVASCFSKKYNMKIVEMDETIVLRKGMLIPEIFEEYGEEYFRNLETEYLMEFKGTSDHIVSCGGGIVLRDKNISLMKQSGKIVLLTASPEVVLERVKDDDERPLLRGKKNVTAIKELMEQRNARYEAAADVVVQTDHKPVEEICKEILMELERMKER